MNLCLTKISQNMARILFVLTMLLCAAALLLGVTQGQPFLEAFGLAILALVVLRLIWRPIVRWLAKPGVVKSWLILTALCFVVKMIWVLAVQVPIEGDYSVFWSYANALATGDVIYEGRYIALFPHIFGYSSFLSWFIRLFGSGPFVAQIVNVGLTICSGSILFRLCYSWRNLQSAISVYLLWITCPSQTIYNSLVLSEPLYTALMLAFLLLMTEVSLHMHQAKRPVVLCVVAGVVGGLLLRWIDGTRPIAAIWIIALLIWIFCLNPHTITALRTWRRWLPFLVLLVGVYQLTGPIWNAQITKAIGEEPANTPGYNMLVGFNQDSAGRWNQEDSDRLMFYSNQPGATASWAQEQILADAKARATTDDMNYPHLFREKLRVFLGSDNSSVIYSSAVLAHTKLFSYACNAFYYMSILLAIAGVIQLWRKKESSTYLLPLLYTVGLTIAQMLVEVAGRYHYSMIPMLLLIGQAALCEPIKKAK
ncbi:MAG: hypothetical protein LUG13_02315 [Oscillospiraceae bacterium]|nr:hypothetical protein [Oscillospiraceae bacterium]